MISVIIPNFNKPENLKKCLQSVQEQTFSDLEVIVVDDGSRDIEVIKAVIEQFRVDKFIQQVNQGAPKARNAGFDVSSGEYVIFLDNDVVMAPDMLDKMYSAIQSSQVDFVYSSFQYGWKIIKSLEFSIDALRKINYIHTSSLVRRSSFPRFDESLEKFQDWDLWLTIVAQGGVGKNIDDKLFKIIDTNGTMSTWWPAFVYKLPWPVFGFTPKSIKKYFQALDIIKEKHNL